MEEWEKIKGAGNAFADSIMILENVNEFLKTKGEEKPAEVVMKIYIVLIVLKALTCEIYLKSLIVKTGNIDVPKIHDLKMLFNKLNADLREEISTSIIVKLKKHDKNYDKNKFDLDLDNIKRAFEKWRYFYEESVLFKLAFFDEFYCVLRDVVNKSIQQ